MLKCPINSNPEEAPVKAPDGSPVVAKVSKFYSELANRAGVVSEAQAVNAALSREFTLLATSVADIPLLTNYNRLESTMARVLGMRSWIWKAREVELTTAGKVQQVLIDRANSAAQLLEYAAVNKALPKIRQLYGELTKAMPSVDKVKIQTLLHDHIVIGQFPKLQNIYDSPVVRAQLETRYQLHIQKLATMGVTPDVIATLDELSGSISQTFDNARALAGQNGMDIDVLENGGYFPIQAQRELQKLLSKQAETAVGSGSAQSFDAASVLNQSRLSTMPAVLDLDKAAQALGISVIELGLKISEPGGISQLLKNKFTPEQLENMFNNGTLVQIPALSDELTEFFSKGLDLPLANLGEAIVLDPERAVVAYNNQLKRAIRNSSFMKTILTEGTGAGWIYDDAALEASGLGKTNFVKLGSNALMQELISSNNLREEVGNLWIHRTVADQLAALVTTNTSFSQLGMLGSFIQQFMKWTGAFKRGAIVATGGLPYVKRVLLQNTVSLNAATGMEGASRYPQALADIARTMKTKSLDHLSTDVFTKIGGTEYSLRDLYELTLFKRGSTFVSGAGETLDQIDARSFMDVWSNGSWQRFKKFQEIYHQRYGSPVTGKIGGAAEFAAELGDKTFRLAYDQLAKLNQASDYAARWAAVRTLANNPKLAHRSQWESFQQLLDYTDEYFNIQENSGQLGRLAGQLALPFASFALVAPGSMARHAIRHPWQYSRMMMLYQQANRNVQLTDAELSEYDKAKYPLFISRDPETGKMQAITPGDVDFYLDTTTWIANNFGLRDSTQTQIQRQINPSSKITDALADIGTKTYIGKVALSLMGIDPDTKENYRDSAQNDTLIGVPLPRALRSAVVSVAPILRSLDRSLPADIVGRPERRDNTGINVVDPGQPGLFGQVPTTGGNRTKSPAIDAASAWARESGLSLKDIDPEKNLVRNYKDFSSIISDLNGALSQVELSIKGGNASEANKARYKQLQEFKGVLEYNKYLVDTVAAKKGYMLPRALEAVRSKVLDDGIKQEALLFFILQQQKAQNNGN